MPTTRDTVESRHVEEQVDAVPLKRFTKYVIGQSGLLTREPSGLAAHFPQRSPAQELTRPDPDKPDGGDFDALMDEIDQLLAAEAVAGKLHRRTALSGYAGQQLVAAS